MKRNQILEVLSEHQVVGVSGFGVQQILCDCMHSCWHTPDEYLQHLADKLEDAQRG